MPNREPGSCPHEPRPGTVVCLYCRHEEHVAGAGRRRARGSLIGASLLATALAAGALLTTSRPDAPDAASPDAAVVTATGATGTGATGTGATAAGAPESAPMVASAAMGVTVPTLRKAPPARQAPPAAPAPVVPQPIVAEGRTTLPGGLFAVRTGDTVEVHFDMPDTRTRRRDKFERIVRETLPAVYGAVADDALADVPAGQLVAVGELMGELPERGVRLRTAEGGTLVVWPSTRPGRDGPLVITYRATFLQ